MNPTVHSLRSPRLWRLRREEAGFTMVELLIVVVLMFVVMGAIYGIWFGLQRSYSFTEDDIKAQNQAQMALGEMVELIRTARLPDPAPTEALNLVIYSADKNSLVCWSDTDRDANHTLELIRFRVDPSTRTLFRDTDTDHTNDPTFTNAQAIRLVSNWVSNNESLPLFRYVGADGLEMTTPVADTTQIREVHIDLHIDVYENNRPIAHELGSVVQPRNLRQY